MASSKPRRVASSARTAEPRAPAKKAATPAARSLPPDALQALMAWRSRDTQSEIARRLGISDGTVSNALQGRYIGNVDRLAERIRGEVLNQQVACPILGPISSRICQDERARPFSARTNFMGVRLWHACKTCPHNPKAPINTNPATPAIPNPTTGEPA